MANTSNHNIRFSNLKFSHTPLRVGITGGIGSGKSYACAKLCKMGYPVYYCDDEAKRIIRTSMEVRRELTNLIGDNVYAPDGTLQKPVLAAFLCSSKENAGAVNRIVHPRVAEDFRLWCIRQTTHVVFMECALLYESGFDVLVNQSVLVTVNEETRLRRVMERDHISEDKARAWFALQMPEEEKAKRADFLLRNDDENTLSESIGALRNWLHL